jgi:hypothetical protein
MAPHFASVMQEIVADRATSRDIQFSNVTLSPASFNTYSFVKGVKY